MDFVWVTIGSLLVLAGTVDLFMTVLYYDEAGPLSTRLYRSLWWSLRRIAAVAPHRIKYFVLSLGVPVMVLASVIFWIALQLLGFAAIYLVGLREGSFRIAEGLGAGPLEALYLSSITLAGLGYGDIAPTDGTFQMVTSLQALLGYGFLTLAIAYVVNVYQVIREMGVLSSDIYHESQRTYEARYILRVHFHNGTTRDLEGRLKTFYHSMIAHHEGMRHYPFVFYFYSRRGYAALPYRFGLISKVIAALHWGLPAGHPVTQEPWVMALQSAFDSIAYEIQERFLPAQKTPEPPKAVDSERFAIDLVRGTSQDSMVRRFLELQEFMEALVQKRISHDPDEAYARYKQWFEFMSGTELFLQDCRLYLGPRTSDG
ncbi:MAG: potassium channel family protein [Actinomycetota bacterium]